MRQSPNTRRVRTRGNGKRHPSSKNFPIESNGPDVKIRGTAQQVMDKYLALARDAASAGDRVTAESYFQHADHYYRIVHSFDNAPDNQNRRRPNNRMPGSPDGPQPDIDDFPEAGMHDNGGGGQGRGGMQDMSLQDDDDDAGDSDNEAVAV
jgi:hypothetical protein